MRIISRIVFFISLIKYTSSQYITVGSASNRRQGKSTCDNSSKSALVEHFFNVIFNEFHTTPPVCVCVQMCPDQPTYCYPNGCLRRADSSKKVEVPLPVTRVSENTKPIFFLEEKNDFMRDLLNKNYLDENKALPELGIKQVNVMPINLRPDPFKDRYKMLFKYKKMPKVELKYNLGEQVKNMMSDVLKKDNVDISKTRWPMNKINPNRLSRPRMNTENQINDNAKFFRATYTEKETSKYPPKYFKRELVNVTNNNIDEIDTNESFGVEKSEFENNTNSLEKLIDSLIENSFKPNKTSKVILEKNTKVIKETELSTIEQISQTTETSTIDLVTEAATTEQIPINGTTNVISMNFTNENIDENKYIQADTTNSSNNVSEMIASLSKKIELQNNTSLEIMRRTVGNLDIDSISGNQIEQSMLKENIEVVTTKNARTTVDKELSTSLIKKGRQRLARKLQNSKNNQERNLKIVLPKKINTKRYNSH